MSEKLLIVSGGVNISDGAYDLEEGKSIEIFNSDFSLSNCKAKHFLDLPPREKAFGGQIGENYVICGGKNYNNNFYNTCFSISNSSGKLNQTYSIMQIERYGAASVVLNNTLYISGGGMLSIRSINSTEVIVQNNQNKIKNLTDLTQPLSGHCAVLLSSEKIMIIGGVNLEEDQSNTYLVDPKEKFESLDGPSMQYKRSYHACGSIVFKEEEYVMVIGGWGAAANKTELYNSGNKNWTERKLHNNLY